MIQKLDDSQQKALNKIVDGKTPISVLTGGPGYGKTFSVFEIYKRLTQQYKNIFFCAPTGKAAKVLDAVLSELHLPDENKPQTIHRMLGCQGEAGWIYNDHNQLPADFVIVDESSMVDSELMARLFTSISPSCRFLLVGDADQLYPVGAGAPFLDIISLNKGDCVNSLKINHRAADGGMIAAATESIKKGSVPVWGEKKAHTLSGGRKDDLFYHNIEDKGKIPLKVKTLCKEWFENKEDFIVLAPQRSGVCGINNLNLELQTFLNPIKKKTSYYKVSPWLTINTGDRVINLKNNYELGVFNGFVGTVLEINYTGKNLKEIIVSFEGQTVVFTKKKDINSLALAYCISVHKSQGSEYRKGIIIFHSSHYYMLSRQLLYVAVSRFKEELHIIGDKKGINRALKNNAKGKRQTYLGEIKE